MRYHQQVRNEMWKVAEAFYNAAPVSRARAFRDLHMNLLGENEKAVLPEPLQVRVLGQEPTKEFWLLVGLRDTIERAWHRESRYFDREIKEG